MSRESDIHSEIHHLHEKIREYEKERKLPHGFMNTSPGTGHLNRTGHKLIAARLAAVLEQCNE